MITIYHNESCSKSLDALQILHDRSIPFEIRNYLEQPLNSEELTELLSKLRMNAFQLLRINEPTFYELNKVSASEDEWIDLMVQHPVLIERPIVVNGDKAIIARPPEKVLEII